MLRIKNLLNHRSRCLYNVGNCLLLANYFVAEYHLTCETTTRKGTCVEEMNFIQVVSEESLSFRRNRLGYPSRKRTRRSASGSDLWMRRQQKQLQDAMSFSESPGVQSAWSESDIGSGPAGDSPMGSLISCSTSIPSPKQLRWAFKSTSANNYGDTTSITSTITSPSGIIYMLLKTTISIIKINEQMLHCISS